MDMFTPPCSPNSWRRLASDSAGSKRSRCGESDAGIEALDSWQNSLRHDRPQQLRMQSCAAAQRPTFSEPFGSAQLFYAVAPIGFLTPRRRMSAQRSEFFVRTGEGDGTVVGGYSVGLGPA